MNPPALALSAHAPDETLALGPQGPVKAARFFADAQSVAEALPASQYVLNTCHDRYLFMVGLGAALLAGRNTTIGVIATDAALDKAGACRLATAGHDGLARAINPVHTCADGDTLFALATGQAPAPGPGLNVLAALAAEAVARACVNAVRAAASVQAGALWLPACAQELPVAP